MTNYKHLAHCNASARTPLGGDMCICLREMRATMPPTSPPAVATVPVEPTVKRKRRWKIKPVPPLMIKHGHVCGYKESRTYKSWRSMRNRCRNPKAPIYKKYGARGIKVCERWDSFENFLVDMGERPEGKTLDRFPNGKGDYEPGNCRWATPSEQARNTSFVRIIEFNGERMPQCDWAKKIGLHRTALGLRLKKWPLEKALTTPRFDANDHGRKL